jgi:hypothetical protein
MIRSIRLLQKIKIGLRRLKGMLELPVMGCKSCQTLSLIE